MLGMGSLGIVPTRVEQHLIINSIYTEVMKSFLIVVWVEIQICVSIEKYIGEKFLQFNILPWVQQGQDIVGVSLLVSVFKPPTQVSSEFVNKDLSISC